MANATCRSCGESVPWHAGRGMRLSDLRCPRCGGALGARRTEQTQARAGQPYERCGGCGRRTQHGTSGHQHAERPWRDGSGQAWGRPAKMNIVPPGPCCWAHVRVEVVAPGTAHDHHWHSEVWAERDGELERFRCLACGETEDRVYTRP